MGSMSLPEVYEELKDKRRQAASAVAEMTPKLAALARQHGFERLALLIDAAREEAERTKQESEELDRLIR